MSNNNESALNKPAVIGSSSLDKLAKECMKHVKCDTARISKPCDKMYLIIGFNRNTKDDEGVSLKGYRLTSLRRTVLWLRNQFLNTSNFSK